MIHFTVIFYHSLLSTASQGYQKYNSLIHLVGIDISSTSLSMNQQNDILNNSFRGICETSSIIKGINHEYPRRKKIVLQKVASVFTQVKSQFLFKTDSQFDYSLA